MKRLTLCALAALLTLGACQDPTGPRTRQWKVRVLDSTDVLPCVPKFTPAVNAQGDTIAWIGTCTVPPHFP